MTDEDIIEQLEERLATLEKAWEEVDERLSILEDSQNDLDEVLKRLLYVLRSV